LGIEALSRRKGFLPLKNAHLRTIAPYPYVFYGNLLAVLFSRLPGRKFPFQMLELYGISPTMKLSSQIIRSNIKAKKKLYRKTTIVAKGTKIAVAISPIIAHIIATRDATTFRSGIIQHITYATNAINKIHQMIVATSAEVPQTGRAKANMMPLSQSTGTKIAIYMRGWIMICVKINVIIEVGIETIGIRPIMNRISTTKRRSSPKI
jgi:hypothetical protein